MISRHERILALMDKIRPVNKYAAAELVEEFLQEEFKRSTSEHLIRSQNLMSIHSMAVVAMKELDLTNIDNRGSITTTEARTLCFVDATIRWLRANELIGFTLKFDKERK